MNDIVAIVIGIVAMLTMAFGIIFFVVLYQRRVIRHQAEINEINKQKELELVQASVRGEEDERMRIAAELHDDVGATLASVKLFLHGQDKNSGEKPVFSQPRELIDETIDKVRNLSHRLQPAVLKQFGLQAGLKSFFDSLNRSEQIAVTHDTADIPRMADDEELGVYRIVQELSNNVLKHSSATVIKFYYTKSTQFHIFTFQHNGDGLTKETFNEQIYKKDAIGLKNIVTRLKSINASISFEQLDDDLFITNINVPV